MFLSILLFFLGDLYLQQWNMLPGIPFLVVLMVFSVLSVLFRYRRVAFFLSGFLFASVFAHYHMSNQLAADLQAKEILIRKQ